MACDGSLSGYSDNNQSFKIVFRSQSLLLFQYYMNIGCRYVHI